MRFPDAIYAQPAALEASRRQVASVLTTLPAPPAGCLITLFGVGASEHAAHGAAVYWRSLGLRAFGLTAAEVTAAHACISDFSLAISESGRSVETLDAVRSLGRRDTIVLTNDEASPLAQATQAVLPLASGEDSPVYTTGYTTTLQALGLLGEAWAGQPRDWSHLPSLAERVLADSQATVGAVAPAFHRARIVDVVAAGPSIATAGEGALLLRESARLHTAAHETRNYLHGPMEPLDTQTAVLVIGDFREVQLAQATSALGCPTLLVTRRTDVTGSGPLTVLRLPDAGTPMAGTVLEILPIQQLGWTLAQHRGLCVDGFRHRQPDTKVG